MGTSPKVRGEAMKEWLLTWWFVIAVGSLFAGTMFFLVRFVFDLVA